uniref:protein disulfide-isomerase n=1 Tax=Myripristis murdjan TaxID=586833 RepID=A0A667YSP6_9TELE
MDIKEPDDIWLIKFYAPWCTFCKQLDPVWHDVASELKSLGSLVNVGKADATAHSGLAKEFKVRGYPAILMLKNDVKYNYMGPRTKDGFLDFADRVAGPLVRALTSPQLFQHAMSRHDVLFLYIGASSTLKGEYMSAAEELIVHTYFFSATRDVLPKAVSLPPLPAVAVFKDGTLFTYNKERDGELKAWINRERFLTYFKIDSYTLYAMGETGKLVALALDCIHPSIIHHHPSSSIHPSSIIIHPSSIHLPCIDVNFHFGYMEGNAYVNGLVMGEVTMPALIVLNLSNDGYFLPLGVVETERHLLDFLDGCQGGNSVLQRKHTDSLCAPLVACFVVSFPLAIVSLLCFVCWKARLPVEEEEERSSEAPRGGQKIHIAFYLKFQ